MEKDLTFEEAIQNLENIVNELETGKLTLDESVKKFEQGIKLSKHCNEILENAEKQITVLIENSNGEMEEEKFDTEDKEGDK